MRATKFGTLPSIRHTPDMLLSPHGGSAFTLAATL